MAVLETECERLIALGATRLRRHEPAPPLSNGFIVMQDPDDNASIDTQADREEGGVPEFGHIVMEDPEGNVFCLD